MSMRSISCSKLPKISALLGCTGKEMTSNEDEGDGGSVVASFMHNVTRAIPPGCLIAVTFKKK